MIEITGPFLVYQIIFEAVAGEGQVMDIAIDDLSVMNGPCPPHGKNSFHISTSKKCSNENLHQHFNNV